MRSGRVWGKRAEGGVLSVGFGKAIVLFMGFCGVEEGGRCIHRIIIDRAMARISSRLRNGLKEPVG